MSLWSLVGAIPWRIPAPRQLTAARGAAAKLRFRGRLFIKYAGLFVAVVCVALTINAALEIWFFYQEHQAALIRIQREQAEAAAAKIGQFVEQIEAQLGWTTQLPWLETTLPQRRLDAKRLLRQVPAITELTQIDPSGIERLRVSRLATDVIETGTDFSKDSRFTVPIAHNTYYGLVYFRFNSEPYMTLALAGSQRSTGVSVAEVNLKFIWDVISQIKVGQHGHAYVVDGNDRLIAHPDINLVLRGTNASGLAQVKAARASVEGTAPEPLQVAQGLENRPVLTAYARIEPLDWLVFVDLPREEAYAHLYENIHRTALFLLAALTMAGLAGILLAQRMVVPIKALQVGTTLIGRGDLAQRIAIKTDDELQELADQFNEMAGKLQDSYAGLEQKVQARTRELDEKSRQLETESKHKSQFLANMSHELRTPLNAILGYTELILDNIYGEAPGRMRQVLERVHSNGRHLLGLINDVLDLAKIEAGQLTLSLADYSMQEVVHDVIVAVEPLAAAKHLAFKSRVPDLLPRGHGDERRIAQVLLNLVGNAIKFTDAGEVAIEASAMNGSFTVAVSDSGPGIRLEDQAKIFDEFQQADSSSTKRKGGTGLGLSIAKRIVELHKGRIWVESKPGQGSTFFFTLPVTLKQQDVQS
jgi:signal transduction histidine kinase